MTARSTPMKPAVPNTGTLTISLLGLTFTTGLIDAISIIALGRVFTANMTGNIVFLAFAIAGVPGLSAGRSVASLLAFMAGAVCGGLFNVRHSGRTQARLLKNASFIEAVLLLAAAIFAIITGSKTEITTTATYGLIVITALAMGLRNAVVRKLAVPDVTTTVLTLTVTGIASDSSLAGGANPRWKTRLASIVTMFAGAATGALLLRYGVVAPLAASSFVAALAYMAARRSERVTH
ncbi:MAG TPA: YoaK family protein [Blastocatellia bacterium]|nr:YoaK family protein [Blastocatellia bacterium]